MTKTKKEKIVEARFNHGRWIADCPDCYGGAEEVVKGEPFVCGNEYPLKNAMVMMSMLVQAGMPQRFTPVDDQEMQERVKAQAVKDGRAYRVKFPRAHKKIVDVLRMRKRENMNWEPGETLADLRAENAEHGIPELGR